MLSKLSKAKSRSQSGLSEASSKGGSASGGKSRSKSGTKKTKKIKKFQKKKEIFTKHILNGRIYIQSTFNNTIATLTDDSGDVIGWVTAGSLGFKGTKKSTPYAATLVGQAIADKVRKIGIQKLKVFVSGVGTGRDSAIRALATKGLNISSIADITSIPHNGCRPKKPRRV